MLSLNLPKYEAKFEKRGGKTQIWDVLRRRYVSLTPEEWVRQHFIHYLTIHKGYPAPLLANEVTLLLHGMKRRCDTILYDRTPAPRMILEYKAPHIAISQKVFDQISRYNLVLRVDYLIVSNGIEHYCCKMDYVNQSYSFLEQIPDYQAL